MENIVEKKEDIKDKKKDDIVEKLVHINRITKVVKGGRRFGFSALVVVGDQAGKVGIAHAKAKQVPDAIKKANEIARRNLIHIPLREGRTIHHDVKAKDGSGKIILRAAAKGTGIIAGGPIRAVCEVLGVKDIVAKSIGTSNAHNVVRATMKALLKQNSPKYLSTIRNKKISEIIEKRGS
ncbi:MAG: 30S ribosomal protein S5 [Alphaproteobacteria bacterium]|nr:30S ribosomal protein S5 [Alphaproteobacteria bacterium]